MGNDIVCSGGKDICLWDRNGKLLTRYERSGLAEDESMYNCSPHLRCGKMLMWVDGTPGKVVCSFLIVVAVFVPSNQIKASPVSLSLSHNIKPIMSIELCLHILYSVQVMSTLCSNWMESTLESWLPPTIKA